MTAFASLGVLCWMTLVQQGPCLASRPAAWARCLQNEGMASRHLHASAFFKEAVERDAVWTLCIDDTSGARYARAGTASGEVALGVWSTENRALRIVSDAPDYARCRPERVDLEDFLAQWLPELDASSTRVGLNWSGPRAQGARVTTYAFVRGLRERQWQLSAAEREARRLAEWGE